jgi:F-type H+-transporting ATPase subunit b
MFNEKFWLAIAFLAFLILIIKYAWPLISKALSNKSKQIAEEILAAKEMKEVAQKLLAKAEKNYQDSLGFAEKLIADAKKESANFAAESKQILESELAKKSAASLERIKMEEAHAIREIKEKIISGALQTFSTEMEKNLDANQKNHLVAQATQQLEKLS